MLERPDRDADDARRQWIEQAIGKIRAATDPAARAALVKDCLAQDQKGDCVQALCMLALESKKESDLRATIAKGGWFHIW